MNIFSKIFKILSSIFFFLGVIWVLYFPFLFIMEAFGKEIAGFAKIYRYSLNVVSVFILGFIFRILSRRMAGEKFSEIIKLKVFPENYLLLTSRLFILLGLLGMIWLLLIGLWTSSWALLVLIFNIILTVLGVFLRYLSQRSR